MVIECLQALETFWVIEVLFFWGVEVGARAREVVVVDGKVAAIDGDAAILDLGQTNVIV